METINDPVVFSHVEKMISFNVRSAIAASFIASHTLKPGGLLVLTGANGAYNSPTPIMIAYGISKAATHQLVSSLAQPGSGLPKDCKYHILTFELIYTQHLLFVFCQSCWILQ